MSSRPLIGHRLCWIGICYCLLWQVIWTSSAGTECGSKFVTRSSVQLVDQCACSVRQLSVSPCSAARRTGYSGPVTDHSGNDWIPVDKEEAYGAHCNISKFHLKAGRTLYIRAWDGTVGGQLVIESVRDILVEGTLDGNGRGFRGGPSLPNASAGFSGEGANRTGLVHRVSTDGGGGGGGKALVSVMGIVLGRPGAGGGYGTQGTSGQAHTADSFSEAGEVYGSSCLDNLFPGSGGGSGANVRPGKVNMFTPLAGQGGSGGAAVLLRSSNGSLVVTTTGTIQMNGNGGQGMNDTTCQRNTSCDQSSLECYDLAGPGGGGSGGSVHLSSREVRLQGAVSAIGGAGGVGYFTYTGCGGNGGNGRIRIDSNQMSGTTFPNPDHSGYFSYCPCKAAPTTHFAPTTVVTSQQKATTTLVATVGSTSAAGDTQSSRTDSVTQVSGQDNEVFPLWGLVVVCVAGILLGGNLVFIIAVCRNRRNGGNLKHILESKSSDTSGWFSDSVTASPVAPVNSPATCAVCREAGSRRCECPNSTPSSVGNPMYGPAGDSQIPLSTPLSRHPSIAKPGTTAGGRRTSISQRKASAGSTASNNNYDLAEGGPGTVDAHNSAANPNYELSIPVVMTERSMSDPSLRTPQTSYQNLQLSHARGVNSRKESVVSAAESNSNMTTDDAGYLVAFGRRTSASAYQNSARTGMSAGASYERLEGNASTSTSPFSEYSRATYTTSVPVSPGMDTPLPSAGMMRGRPRSASHGAIGRCDARYDQLSPSLSPGSSRSTAATSSAVSPNDDKSAVFKFPNVHTPHTGHTGANSSHNLESTDSGIDEDAGTCYAVVPLTGSSFCASPGQSEGKAAEIKRPGSADQMKVTGMSPIPEHGGGEKMSSKELALPVPGPAAHQYSEIPCKSPSAKQNGKAIESQSFNVSAV